MPASPQARKLRCPLIVRPTSEDVITGHVFQTLGIINPRWWLADMLNLALGAPAASAQMPASPSGPRTTRQ